MSPEDGQTSPSEATKAFQTPNVEKAARFNPNTPDIDLQSLPTRTDQVKEIRALNESENFTAARTFLYANLEKNTGDRESWWLLAHTNLPPEATMFCLNQVIKLSINESSKLRVRALEEKKALIAANPDVYETRNPLTFDDRMQVGLDNLSLSNKPAKENIPIIDVSNAISVRRVPINVAENDYIDVPFEEVDVDTLSDETIDSTFANEEPNSELTEQSLTENDEVQTEISESVSPADYLELENTLAMPDIPLIKNDNDLRRFLLSQLGDEYNPPTKGRMGLIKGVMKLFQGADFRDNEIVLARERYLRPYIEAVAAGNFTQDQLIALKKKLSLKSRIAQGIAKKRGSL